MKIYYWAPFFTNIATIKAVINSAKSLLKFSKKNRNYETNKKHITKFEITTS